MSTGAADRKRYRTAEPSTGRPAAVSVSLLQHKIGQSLEQAAEQLTFCVEEAMVREIDVGD